MSTYKSIKGKDRATTDDESNKIEFTEPFECSFTEDSITIGHLHFTFSPK